MMKQIYFSDGSLWLSGKNLKKAEALKDDKNVEGPDGTPGKGITVKEFMKILYPENFKEEE